MKFLLLILVLLGGCASAVQGVRNVYDAIYYTGTPAEACAEQGVADDDLAMCVVYIEQQRRNRRGY